MTGTALLRKHVVDERLHVPHSGLIRVGRGCTVELQYSLSGYGIGGDLR